MTIRNTCFFLFVFLTQNACTGNVSPLQTDTPIDATDIQRRIDIATSLFKQHDYYASLIQWKILQSIKPDNPEFKNRSSILITLIDRRIKLHMNKVQKAFDNKDNATAEWGLLKILSLNPDHQDSIFKLKQIELSRDEKFKKTKTEKNKYQRKLFDEIRESLGETLEQR